MLKVGFLLFLYFLLRRLHMHFPIRFPFFCYVCPLLIFLVLIFFIPWWPLQPSCDPFCLRRCLAFVSTLVCVRLAWIFSVSNQCVELVNVTGFTINVMASIDCCLYAFGSRAGRIDVVVALSFFMAKWPMSTCPLLAVQKRKYMHVALRQLLVVIWVWHMMVGSPIVLITLLSRVRTIPLIC